ncbi:MAG: phosphatase PAP2 family protein [Betaproteobacteria bacterium]|jgi:membrane-associated phospholipid phosphatase
MNLKDDKYYSMDQFDRTLKINFLIAFVLLILLSSIQLFDLKINVNGFIAINSRGNIADEKVWSFITLMGDTGILWPMLLIFSITSMKTIYAVLAAVPMGGFLSVLLKKLFDSPRPSGLLELVDIHVIGPVLTTHSYPSGHTITIFAAISAIVLSYSIQAKLLGSIFKIGLFIFATVVGISRIMVGAHWPLDCLAGACVGWISGVTGIYLSRKYLLKIANQNIDFVAVALLWVLSIWNFYREFDYALSNLAVIVSFVISSTMLFFYIIKQKKSITSFFP